MLQKCKNKKNAIRYFTLLKWLERYPFALRLRTETTAECAWSLNFSACIRKRLGFVSCQDLMASAYKSDSEVTASAGDSRAKQHWVFKYFCRMFGIVSSSPGVFL